MSIVDVLNQSAKYHTLAQNGQIKCIKTPMESGAGGTTPWMHSAHFGARRFHTGMDIAAMKDQSTFMKPPSWRNCSSVMR